MYFHLSLFRRITIFAIWRQGCSLRQIAAQIGVSASTICRELARHKRRKCGSYDPANAHRLSQARRRRASRRPRKLTPEVWRKFKALIKQHRSALSAAVFLPVGASAIYNRLRRDVCRDSHMKPPRPRRKMRRQSPHRYLRHGVLTYRKRPKGKGFAPMRDATPIALRPPIVDARARFGDVEAAPCTGAADNFR